jgi:hypothetical protein
VIWFATARGVSSLHGNEWKHYTASDGLNLPEGTERVAADNQGRVWFTTPYNTESVSMSKRPILLAGSGLRLPLASDSRPAEEKLPEIYTNLVCYDGKRWDIIRIPDPFVGASVLAVAPDGKVWIRAVCYPHRVRGWGSFSGSYVMVCGGGRLYCFDGKAWIGSWEHGSTSSILDVRREMSCHDGFFFDGAGGAWFWGRAAEDSGTRVPYCSGTSCKEYSLEEAVKALSPSPGASHNITHHMAIATDGSRYYVRKSALRASDGKAWREYSGWNDLPVKEILCIAADPAGRLWVSAQFGYSRAGIQSGLSCFDGKTWRTWTTKDFLAGNDIRHIVIDPDGSAWAVATHERVDPKGTQWPTTGVSHISLEKGE